MRRITIYCAVGVFLLLASVAVMFKIDLAIGEIFSNNGIEENGTISGYVADAETNTRLLSARIGTWDVYASAESYHNSDTLQIEIFADDTDHQDWYLQPLQEPIISLQPPEFNFELDWGETETDILTIDNLGVSPLTWNASVSYNDIGLLRRQATHQTSQHRGELDDPYFLLIMDNMLWYQTIQEALTDYGVPFDINGSWQLEDIDLTGYTVIMIPSAQSTDTYTTIFQTNGEALEGWITDGGWLAFLGSTQPGNHWTTFDGVSEVYQMATPNTALIPDHPLLNYLVEVPPIINGSSTNYIVNLPENALVITFGNNEDQPTLIEYDYGLGNVIISTQTLETGYRYHTEMGLIFQNLIAYAAESAEPEGWLHLEPNSGTVNPDQETEVELQVTMDNEDLVAGVYYALVTVNSNDPEHPVTTIPVTVNLLTGAPISFTVNAETPFITNYFELISTWVDPSPFVQDAETLFGTLPELVIVYNHLGGVYIPDLINTLGNFDVAKGYRIFIHQAEEPGWLTFRGYPVPEDFTYHVTAHSWNWLGYPFPDEIPVEIALTNLREHLRIVMNDRGLLWIPDLINTLGMMVPGEGYYIFTEEEVDFTYFPGGLLDVSRSSDLWTIPSVADPVNPTGIPYAILITLDETLTTVKSSGISDSDLNPAGRYSQYLSQNLAVSPAILEVYDGNLLVGKSPVLIDRDFTPVIAWGGSERHQVAGFKSGEEMTIIVKDANGAVIPTRQSNNPKFGVEAYGRVTLSASNVLPSEFSVGKAYPNPFNPSITIPFAVPKTGEVSFTLFNILGQRVYEVSRVYEAGYHQFQFNLTASGDQLVSGVYFIQARLGNQRGMQKILLLK